MNSQLQKDFEGLQKRSTWMASYSINGHLYGLGLNHEHDVRPPQFFRLVPSARRILELGSCQGGGTFQLARHRGVQEIVAEQAPFIYLVNQNALSAVSSAVEGANPGILSPQTFWNAERITLKANQNANARASR